MKYFVCFLCLLVGCSQSQPDAPSLAECQGTVTYNGKPLASANVTFIVPKSPIAVGQTNAEGKFTLTTGGRKGAPIGVAKVSISKASANAAATASMKPEDMQKMQMEQMKDKTKSDKPEVPVKYSNPESSGLTADVSANSAANAFEFPLVD